MRIALALLSAVLSSAASAADPEELLTAPDAILCLRAESLETATVPDVARSQIVLRAMGCLRSEAGVRTRMVGNAPGGGAPARAWQVRFYPDGISSGVVLWGKPSSFTAPDALCKVAALGAVRGPYPTTLHSSFSPP